MRVAEAVTLPETIFASAFEFLREHAHPDQTPKLTIPSPSMVHYRGGNSSIDPAVYPDKDRFWDDLTAAYAAQIAGVYELGCRYLQLDDTSLAYVNDPAQRSHIEQIGGDPEHLHEQYIANINAALADKPDDLVVTAHLCRGNNPVDVGCRGRLRVCRRSAVRRPECRRLLPRVRRRAFRDVRAAALRHEGLKAGKY